MYHLPFWLRTVVQDAPALSSAVTMRAFLALCLLAVAGTASARLASIVQVGTSATPTATISPTRQGVELLPYNPSPNPKSTVSAGTARFTVLTDRLIHIQRAPKPAQLGDTPAFDDRATLAVVNRFLPEPQFSSSVAGMAVVNLCGVLCCPH